MSLFHARRFFAWGGRSAESRGVLTSSLLMSRPRCGAFLSSALTSSISLILSWDSHPPPPPITHQLLGVFLEPVTHTQWSPRLRIPASLLCLSQALTLALSLRAALLPLRTPCDFLVTAGHDVSVGDGNCGKQAFRDVQVRCVCGAQCLCLGVVTYPVFSAPPRPLLGQECWGGWSWGLLSPRVTSSDETPAGWAW